MMGVNDGEEISPFFQASDSLRVLKLRRLIWLQLGGRSSDP
jgi:hypothetical protein